MMFFKGKNRNLFSLPEGLLFFVVEGDLFTLFWGEVRRFVGRFGMGRGVPFFSLKKRV